MYCKKCDWYFNDETCPKCGDEGTGEIEPNICPICNTPNDESEKFCKKCKCFLEPGESNYDDCYEESEEEHIEEIYVIKDPIPILCYIIAGIGIVSSIGILVYSPSFNTMSKSFSVIISSIFVLAIGRIVNYLKKICNKLNEINFIDPNKNEKEQEKI